ncbi:hypothetical protein KP05_09360 [Cobetia amphilecti]|nr:hypothetical protein KP05_09360 [Cobetia amphilecti]
MRLGLNMKLGLRVSLPVHGDGHADRHADRHAEITGFQGNQAAIANEHMSLPFARRRQPQGLVQGPEAGA